MFSRNDVIGGFVIAESRNYEFCCRETGVNVIARNEAISDSSSLQKGRVDCHENMLSLFNSNLIFVAHVFSQ
jgi:hypothetical protein